MVKNVTEDAVLDEVRDSQGYFNSVANPDWAYMEEYVSNIMQMSDVFFKLNCTGGCYV